VAASGAAASDETNAEPARKEADDMDQIASTLQGELRRTVDRLKDLGGAVVFEDYPGAFEESDQGEVGGDSVSATEQREMSFTVRSLLVERANRLAEALDRLRSGEYGTCEVCGESIAAARLRAMPELTTCVRCQEAEELAASRPAPVRGR
jgi:DnaK suppressor protein